LDGRVLLFAALATALTAALAGLAPALWGAGADLSASLRSGARVGSGSPGLRAVRQALVVGQVALALLVLAGAGLLVRSLVRLQQVDMGFARERLLIVSAALPSDKAPTRPEQLALLDEVLARVGAVPGVAEVTPLASRPFAGTGGWDAMFSAEGQSAERQATNPYANLEVVAPGYFRTLEIPIRRGRGFAAQDREDA